MASFTASRVKFFGTAEGRITREALRAWGVCTYYDALQARPEPDILRAAAPTIFNHSGGSRPQRLDGIGSHASMRIDVDMALDNFACRDGSRAYGPRLLTWLYAYHHKDGVLAPSFGIVDHDDGGVPLPVPRLEYYREPRQYPIAPSHAIIADNGAACYKDARLVWEKVHIRIGKHVFSHCNLRRFL